MSYTTIEEVIKDGYFINIEKFGKKYVSTVLKMGKDYLEEVGFVTSNSVKDCLDGVVYRLGAMGNEGVFNINYPVEESKSSSAEEFLDRQGSSVCLRRNDFAFENEDLQDKHLIRGTLRNFDGKHNLSFSANHADRLVDALGDLAKLAKDAYGEDMDFSGRAENFYM